MSAREYTERNPIRRVLPVPCARRPVDIGKRVPAATATNVRRFGTESFRRVCGFSDGTPAGVALAPLGRACCCGKLGIAARRTARFAAKEALEGLT